MGVHDILAQIDREISQLKEARALLEGGPVLAFAQIPRKRNLTPEGRRRIAEAVKRRWALEKANKLAEAAGQIPRDSSRGNLAYQTSRV